MALAAFKSMKTEAAEAPAGAEANNGAAKTSSQPGNMSTQQLAASLLKTAPSGTANSDEAAQGEAAQGAEPKKGAKGSSREPNAKGKRAPKAATEQENVEPEEAPEETPEQQPENPENSETPEAPEEPEQPENPEEEPEEAEAPEEPEEPEQSKPELPEELSQAIEDAKSAGEEGKAKMLKRIHKLVDERDTQRNHRLQVEEQNRQLSARVEELQKTGGQGNAPAAGNQVHPEVAKVSQELANVDHWRNWCSDNPEGGEVPDGKGGKLELDAATVKQLSRRLDDQRTELVARKVQTERAVEAGWNAAYTQHHTEALERYPWLKNQNSPEYVEMQGILKAFPAIKSSPDYEKVLAWMFRGRAAEEAEVKAKSSRTGPNGVTLKKAAPAREPTKVPTNPPNGGAGRRPTKEEATTAAAEKEFKSSGSTRDLAKMFAARGRAVSK